MANLPIVLQNLIENISSKSHQLEWEIHGGKDSEVVQITLTWRNTKNISINDSGVDEAAEWNRLKRDEFFEGFSPITNNKEAHAFENTLKEPVPLQKPTPLRKIEIKNEVSESIESNSKPICNGIEPESEIHEEEKLKPESVPVKKEPAILTKLRETSQASKLASAEQKKEEKPMMKSINKLRRSETMPAIEVNSDRESSDRVKKKNPFRRSKKDKSGKGGKLHLALNLECDSQTDDAFSDFEELYRDYNKKMAPVTPLVNVQEVVSSGNISEEEASSKKKKYKGSLSEEAATIGAKILANRRYSLKRGSLEGGVKDFLEKENQNLNDVDNDKETETTRKPSSAIQMLDQLSVHNIKNEEIKIVISDEESTNVIESNVTKDKDDGKEILEVTETLYKNSENISENGNESIEEEKQNINDKPLETDSEIIMQTDSKIIMQNPVDSGNLESTDNEHKFNETTSKETLDKTDVQNSSKEDKVEKPKKRKIGEWTSCQDCLFSGFCDERPHKDEYMKIILEDANDNDKAEIECTCNVCNGGAVNNGCVYREIVRLRNEYKLFDKRNRCYCRTCVPFKYRTMCLRQELRVMRQNGQDEYSRLTSDGPDGRRAKLMPTVSYSDNESSDDDFKVVISRSRKR